MKLVIDEKLKHRLVGLAVVLSLGAIFLPAILKKSNQRLENNLSVKVQLPPKPKTPKVVMTDENEMFKTIKIVKMETPPAATQRISDMSKSAQAKEGLMQSAQITHDTIVPVIDKTDLKSNTDAAKKPIELALMSNAANNVIKKQSKVVVNKLAQSDEKMKVKVIKKTAITEKNRTSPLNKKDFYAVQLASFSKLTNAQVLVNKLRSKGYKANYVKIASRQGMVYKVYVGHSPIKSDAMKLKIQLASAMQLNGFVVNTRMS